MNIKNIVEAEISAQTKTTKPINVHLVSHGNGIYKGFLPFKIDGDYILNSKTIKNEAVSVEFISDHVVIEIESNEDRINAFLTKDESSILKAILFNMRNDSFISKPSFIVGPPGTGKTKVITKILEEEMKLGHKVLVVSSTNMAVENVFERIDAKAIGLKDGELVLTIKSELKSLEQFSLESVKNKKLRPFEDELEILKMVKDEMLKKIRDAEPTLNAVSLTKEAAETKLRNLKRDTVQLDQKLAKKLEEKANIQNRINALTGNTFIRGVAEIFMSKKLEEFEDEKKAIVKKIVTIEEDINKISTKMVKAKREFEDGSADYSKTVQELNEAKASLGKISSRVKEISKKIEETKAGNLFSSAKIVGSTLVNAALNKRIQACEFDKIIVDEASMALIPVLLVAAQSLNEKKVVKHNYKDDDSLYPAQNKAVELALNSKLVFVGDPQQLPPIAQTQEMKQSIFSMYGVDEIFNGNTVKNTIFLDINFRNHPKITELASKLFYSGMLKSGKEDDGKDSLFVRRSLSRMVLSEGSYVNHGNMKIVVEQTIKALKRGRRNIGVITPYRKQALLIEEQFSKIREEYPDANIQAGTIHTFQGKEKEIIIYDLTFSPDVAECRIPATYDGGETSTTAKLLNVAMTRAKDFFIVIGNVDGILSLNDDTLILKEWVRKIVEVQE